MQTAEELPAKPKKSRKGIGGRPSKYNPELLRKAKEYLDTYQDKGHKMPTLAGLSLAIGINKETAQVWSKDKNKRQFSVLCDRIRMIQEQLLLDNGLDSTWNSNITKLVLSKHGYHDNPQGNQANTGITVQVNRGGVVLKSGGQTLEVSTEAETTGTTLEHKPD